MAKTFVKVSVLDKAGEKASEVSLPEAIFGAKVNPPLIAQAVRVYLSNQRKAYPKAKTRGEVSGSGKKIWPQKGTGQARHGDRYAPIFVGGGRAHGPKGNQVYQKKLSKKIKTAALISALSAQQKEGKIKIVKGIKRLRKTKSAQESLQKWFKDDYSSVHKYLLVLPQGLDAAQRAFRNLPNIQISTASQIHPYQVLNFDWVIFTTESLEELENRLLKK
jgi:large subunit ribosomal protein L4